MEAKTRKLVAYDRKVDVAFGTSASVSENKIVIGASLAAGRTTTAGSFYLFERDLSGKWVARQPKIFASDGVYDGRFGFECEISGDVIVTGAYGVEGKRAVYIY